MEEQSETKKAIENARRAMFALAKILHQKKIVAYIDFDDFHRCLMFQEGYVHCAEQKVV